MSGDKRNSFRLEEAVQLDVKRLSEEEWRLRIGSAAESHSGISNVHGALEALSHQVSRKLIDVRRVSRTVAECFELVNRKLDVLAKHVAALEQSKAEIDGKPLRMCEISSTGIRYPSKRGATVGERLRLRVSIVSAGLYFETLGKVVRTEPVGEDSDEMLVAVQFHGLREADQDLLIRHLLGRQSETLRARRLQLEETGEHRQPG